MIHAPASPRPTPCSSSIPPSVALDIPAAPPSQTPLVGERRSCTRAPPSAVVTGSKFRYQLSLPSTRPTIDRGPRPAVYVPPISANAELLPLSKRVSAASPYAAAAPCT